MLDIVKAKFGFLFILSIFCSVINCDACIWDAKTLWTEKHEHPTLADAILHPKTEKLDVKGLKADIQKLKANPQTNDPMWWNNLAGSYLRLGQPAEAVKILEPLTNRFPKDYGIHANLGTAYHLLGRYVEAEREIRRDTEINTNAHFGLEKYHLALLQYLIRDEKYRFRHVYVDEFSAPWLASPPHIWLGTKMADFYGTIVQSYTNEAEFAEMETTLEKNMKSPDFETSFHAFRDDLCQLIVHDKPADYRKKWDLKNDPKLEDGVIYMATLNPKVPACWVMLGVVAQSHTEYHLAKTAFEHALELNSPQLPLLKMELGAMQTQLNHTEASTTYFWVLVLSITSVITLYVLCKIVDFRRKTRTKA